MERYKTTEGETVLQAEVAELRVLGKKCMYHKEHRKDVRGLGRLRSRVGKGSYKCRSVCTATLATRSAVWVPNPFETKRARTAMIGFGLWHSTVPDISLLQRQIIWKSSSS